MDQPIAVVKFYLEDKGYGFIIHEGVDYFFHITNCNYTPKLGDQVYFTLKQVKKGINAFDITPSI